MINIQITGNSLKDCHSQILALAKEISQIPGDVAVGSTKESIEEFTGHKISQAPDIKNPESFVTNTVTNGDTDAAGIRYDERIHSGSKEKTNKGLWKRRRGVDDSLVEQVEAEQKAGPKAEIPIPSIPTSHIKVEMPMVNPGNNIVEMVPDEVPAQYAQPPVVEQAAPMQAPQPVPVIPPNMHTFASFKTSLITVLNDLANNRKIDEAWINGIKNQFFGGKEIHQWAENEPMMQELFNNLVAWNLLQEYKG